MMDEYDYIDNYFNGLLSPEEMKQFDQKIQEDQAFAEEVAFYCGTLQEIKEQVKEEKKERFREIYEQANITGQAAPVKRVGNYPVKKLWPYIAVAAVLTAIVLGVFIFSKPSAAQLADQYIQQHFKELPVTMNSREDNMQKGLRLYNEHNFPAALQQFENILQTDTSDFAAKKDAGIVCLRMEQYDKALDYFRQIAAKPGYYSNPGLFYGAITLLKRNQPGDTETVKKLLQQVVENDLEGKEDAVKWLRRWK